MTESFVLLTLLLVLGALVGSTVSGVVGMGGGALLLAIILLLGFDPEIAIPLHAAVQLVSNATRAFAHRNNIRWRIFLWFAVFALPGPVLGMWLLQSLDTPVVIVLLGVAILYAAWAPKWGLGNLPIPAAFGTAGFLCGTLGVVVGAVGPVMAPFYLRDDLTKEQIIATKAMSAGFTHIIKLIAFTAVGFELLDHAKWVLPMAAATIVGTYVGKWLLTRLTETRFRLIYRVILTLLAVRLIWKAFT